MSSQIKFILNNQLISTNVPSGSTLLDYIRNVAKLTGTKEGCREGDCGACTVLLGESIDGNIHYKTINSCIFPLGNVNGKHVVTIEGISENQLTPVQHAYVNENASQCGFCTPGFIISTTGYLIENDIPNINAAIESIAGNICRCTGYRSIERALKIIVEEFRINDRNTEHLTYLVDRGIIPEYFLSIPQRMKEVGEMDTVENDISFLVGGGTDLYIQKEDVLKNKSPIFVNKYSQNKIWQEGKKIFIPGSTSFQEFADSKIIQQIIPDIKIYNNLIASLPIRNSATIAGNIVNASPIGDISIILLSLDAVLILENDNQFREIPLRNFFTGYKVFDKLDSEVISLVQLEVTDHESLFTFEKISKRTHLDIATVNSAIRLYINDNKIESCMLSIGGVAPIPLFLEKTSSFLEGKKIESEVLVESLKIIDGEITPISDIRGSANYKRLLAKQIFKSHFLKLFPEIINMDSF